MQRLLTLFPVLILFSLAIQAITGFCLWLYYSPSVTTAWESVYYVQYKVTCGWLLRGFHHYSAQVLLVLLMVYIAALLFSGAYRLSKRWSLTTLVSWWLVVGMFLCCLCALLTGELLPWDQNAVSATKTRVGYLTLIPWVGESLKTLAVGGENFGNQTLTRFLALHIGVFGGGMLFLGGLSCYASWRDQREKGRLEPSENKDAKPKSLPVAAYGAACLLLLAVIAHFCFAHGWTDFDRGVALGSPGDLNPLNSFPAARPDWSFLGFYGLTNYFPSNYGIMPVFVVPSLMVLFALAMPAVGRWLIGHIANLLVAVGIFAALVVLSFQVVDTDRLDATHQTEIAKEKLKAKHAVAVAWQQGIPRQGILARLTEHSGQQLFEKHCASCHPFSASLETLQSVVPTSTGRALTEPIVCEAPSAPDLYQFASEKWLSEYFSAPSSEKFFGNTRFNRGMMSEFIAVNKKKVLRRPEKMYAALAAQAGYTVDPKTAAEGDKMLTGKLGCTQCHQYNGEGPAAGHAPTLTKYGSREWLLGAISDITAPQFYGKQNDRMPTFFKLEGITEEDPQDNGNTMTFAEVTRLVDWLRLVSGAKRQPMEVVEVFEVVETPNLLPAEASAGMQLFVEKQCVFCHPWAEKVADDGTVSDGLPAVLQSAPNLRGFGSRKWNAGLLNARTITSNDYYGTTLWKKGAMTNYIKESFTDDDEGLLQDEQEDIITALTFESTLGAGGLATEKIPAGTENLAAIKSGRELIAEECTECHRWYTDPNSAAPAADTKEPLTLVGYGSPDWTRRCISNPSTDDFFHGAHHFGMPAYHAFPAGSGKNLMTPQELETLTDWLLSR